MPIGHHKIKDKWENWEGGGEGGGVKNLRLNSHEFLFRNMPSEHDPTPANLSTVLNGGTISKFGSKEVGHIYI